ncbi:MAG: hypothetical protein NTV93_09800 [Verrucomicrobia bacterium]|nr:hypothetical protein [Verrucomicrobiota bacterium]
MKPTVLVCTVIVGALAILHGAEPPPASLTASNKLLAAISAGDYAAFVADGDAAFQSLKREQFESVAAQLGPRFKSGYDVTYLGDMHQKGYEVTLWRLRFADGGDDFLATLSLKAGKVGGYWIK